MKKIKRISHLLECRSVITSEDANKCPLCRVRAAGPDLLDALKLMVKETECYCVPELSEKCGHCSARELIAKVTVK